MRARVVLAPTIILGAALLSAAATAAPPEALVTEPVEPGVVRVISDGIRDLVPVGGVDTLGLAVGGDGSVWVSRDGGIVRLGDSATYPDLGGDVEAGTDGTLWALSDWVLYRLDGDFWTVARQTARGGVAAFDIAPDGRVWSAWLTNLLVAPYGGFGILEADGWTDQELGDELTDLIVGGEPEPLAALDLTEFQVAADGTAWMAWTARTAGPDERTSAVLLGFDGRAWRKAEPIVGGRLRRGQHLDVGADGTLWAYLETDRNAQDPAHLARLADGAWATYDQRAFVGPIYDRDASQGVLAVGPDGRAWMSDGPCGGLRSFDGTTWTSYLDGVCVTDIEPGPDGSIWVVGGVSHGHGSTPTAIYRVENGPATGEVDDIAARGIPG